jgi:hypothetical protein
LWVSPGPPLGEWVARTGLPFSALCHWYTCLPPSL